MTLSTMSTMSILSVICRTGEREEKSLGCLRISPGALWCKTPPKRKTRLAYLLRLRHHPQQHIDVRAVRIPEYQRSGVSLEHRNRFSDHRLHVPASDRPRRLDGVCREGPQQHWRARQ